MVKEECVLYANKCGDTCCSQVVSERNNMGQMSACVFQCVCLISVLLIVACSSVVCGVYVAWCLRLLVCVVLCLFVCVLLACCLDCYLCVFPVIVVVFVVCVLFRFCVLLCAFVLNRKTKTNKQNKNKHPTHTRNNKNTITTQHTYKSTTTQIQNCVCS